MKRYICVASIAATLFTTPASAGDRGGGTNWGAVVGAGILGGMVGAATAPAPQQIIIVQPQPIYVVPQPPPVAPQPVVPARPVATQYQEDLYPGFTWCEATHQWYRDTVWLANCPVPPSPGSHFKRP